MADTDCITEFNGNRYKYRSYFQQLSNDELMNLGINEENSHMVNGKFQVTKSLGCKILKKAIDEYLSIPKIDADIHNLVHGKKYFIEYLGSRVEDGDYWGLTIQERFFNKYSEPNDTGIMYASFYKGTGIIKFPPSNGNIGYTTQHIPIPPNPLPPSFINNFRIKEPLNSEKTEPVMSELKEVSKEWKLLPQSSNVSFIGEDYRKAEERFNANMAKKNSKGGKRNKTKRNKKNKTKRNKTKRNKTKRNKTKRNKK